MEIFVTYVVGTVIGMWIYHQIAAPKFVAMTIRELIAQGFLKTKINAQGEVDILKHDQQD